MRPTAFGCTVLLASKGLLAADVFVHVFLYVNIFWGVCESSGVSVQWPGISSPCSHSQYRNASCQPPRRKRGGGLSSAPSCSRSGPLRLNRELMMKMKQVSSKKRNEDREESTVRWGGGAAEKRAKGTDSWSTSIYEQRHERTVGGNADFSSPVQQAQLNRSFRWRSSAGLL